MTISHQFTNVLADILLCHTLTWWGPWWAEHSVVALAVLVFFWGAWAFIVALTRERPWYLMPVLPMLAYGSVFRYGFLNFYLSLGLCLWAASLLCSWRYVPGFVLLSLAVIAHPLPPVCFVAIVVYIRMVRRVRFRRQLWIWTGTAAAIFAGRLILGHTLRAVWPGVSITRPGTYLLLGESQILLYGQKYRVLAAALALLWSWWIVRLFRKEGARSLASEAVFQVFTICVLVSVLCPYVVNLPGNRAPASLLTCRITLITGVLLCAALSRVTPPRWERAMLAVIAAVFFSFAYVDERALNKFEDHLRAYVSTLPVGQRVVTVFHDNSGLLPSKLTHVVDRPCLGHCFDYGNYEPGSGQFRIRATGQNEYVLATPDAIKLVEGDYIVKNQDQPLYRIHICEAKTLRFCETRLSPGEMVRAEEVAVLPDLW